MKFYEPKYREDEMHGAIIIDQVGVSIYSAEFRGEELCRHPSPLWKSAEVLLARGFPPDFHLEMVRRDWVVSMGGPIGTLAANLNRKVPQ